MEYVRPDTIGAAVARIAEGGTPLAGGTVVVPRVVRKGMRLALVDISRLRALEDVAEREGHLYVGALARLERLAEHPALQASFAAVARAAAAVGNPQVRRAATLGGNLALRLPISDLMPALVALGAEVVCAGPEGEAPVPALQFATDGVAYPHLITGVRLPLEGAWRSDFVKFAWRRASGKTVVNVAAALRLEEDRIVAARLALGRTTTRAPRLSRTEQLLTDRRVGTDLVQEAAATAAEEAALDVPSRVGTPYRRQLVAAGVRQLLTAMTKP